MQPLVSVIIPVYNAEKYLNACLDSLAAQTYPHLEIILVDDGSTDASPKLCDRYAAADKRFKVIHQKNAGPSAARNAGLNVATGAYVGFVDSDDTISAETYQTAVESIEKYNADWVMWNTERPSALAQGLVEGAEYRRAVLSSIIKSVIGPSACLELFRRNILQQYQIKFPENIHNNEDYLFVLQYALKTVNIYYLKKSYFYKHEAHQNSVSSSYKADWPEQIQLILRQLRALFSSQEDKVFLSYYHAKVLCYAVSLVKEQSRARGLVSFSVRLKIIQDFWSLPEVQESFGAMDVSLLSLPLRILFVVGKRRHYRTLYFLAWSWEFVGFMKRKILLKIRF